MIKLKVTQQFKDYIANACSLYKQGWAHVQKFGLLDNEHFLHLIEENDIIMRISYHSYAGTQSTGKFNITVPINAERVKGRDCIIIEDIVDTGRTLQKVISDLKAAGAKSVKVICVLDKVGKHPKLPILFRGFNIADKFVIGYGMDYDGKFRDLKHIYAAGLEKEEELVL